MKKIMPYSFCLIFIGCISFVSCNKEMPVSSVVTPRPQPPPPLSPPSTINLNMVPIDTLSKARYNIVAGAAGNKILFAGGFYIVPRCWYDSSEDMPGWYDCRYESNRVDIYNTSTQSWATHDLARNYYSHNRSHEPAVTVGNKIFFSGGADTVNNAWSDKVDVYDASANNWSVIQLSEPRVSPAVGALSNKVFFAGGSTQGPNSTVSGKVDIYDVSTNSWSSATLSEARTEAKVVAVDNKIIFAGGWNGNGASAVVDIYDASSNTWSVATLSEATGFITAFTIGNEAFFIVGAPGNSIPPPRKIDVYNSNTNSWSVKEINFFAEGYPSVNLNNKALVFFGNTVHIYNASNSSWSDGVLDTDIGYPAIIAVGNSIYFGGGSVSGGGQTNKVWKLEL
ncbi:MAG: Kelch repeat-containing protein [Chitinophagaceae bacterium]